MAQPSARTPICCLDLDTFFVSVERLMDSSLVGKAVIVGARPNQRGVVSACSYEVRPLGVHSGMSTTEAARLAPDAVFLPTRLSLYAPYTQRVRHIIERFTPAVQTASIDEFYLNFAGCEGLYSQPQDANPEATLLRVVRAMRQQIQTELGLPASGGVAANRAVAKIASRLAKPAGVCMIDPASARAIIGPMGVRTWPGIGPSTQRRLVDAGIQTLDQLIDLPAGRHRAAFGGLSDRVRDALGPTRHTRNSALRAAFREHDGVDAVGSISNERTFMADVGDRATIDAQLRALSERVVWRARKRKLLARTVTLKLRYADFQTLTRSRTIPATDQERVVLATVRDLLDHVLAGQRAVRLLGIALTHLVPHQTQLCLPFAGTASQDDCRARISSAVDTVRQRFGYDAIRLGVTKRPGQ